MRRHAVRNQPPARGETRRGAARRPARARSRLRAFLGLLFAGAAAYALFAGPVFRIQRIEADVPEECRPLVEDGAPLGRNLFLFPCEALRESVARHPIVASVTVTRVLPDTLRVVAEPRVACARIRLPLGDFDIDRNGVIFRAAAAGDAPLLVGADAVGALGGVVDAEVMEAVAPWLDALPRYALPPVSKIHYLGGRKCNLALADGRLVKLGRAEDVELKLAAAEALLAGPARGAEYVDMEVTNAGVIGHRRPEPAVAAAPAAQEPSGALDPTATAVEGKESVPSEAPSKQASVS